MKTKSLQLGKAMSAALFVLLLSVAGMKNALAQTQTQIATLQHGDSISGVFYGQNALVSAYNAAVDGDVITLSSGTYAGASVTKEVTIHGAGCVYDAISNEQPTVILSSCYFGDNVSVEGVRFMDGVNIGGCGLGFRKCCFENVQNHFGDGSRENVQFFDCIIKSFSSDKFPGALIVNSVVKLTDYLQNDPYHLVSIYNSVVLFNNGLNISNLTANNSIIATVSGHNISNCTFNNCIGIETGETSLFEGQTASNCMEVNNYEDVFETFTGEVTYDNIYQLKEEIATTFLGNDGTEVGIYGGMMPYNPRPSYMVMKRCNVAPRSTVDGKLSVDIEVLTEGE